MNINYKKQKNKEKDMESFFGYTQKVTIQKKNMGKKDNQQSQTQMTPTQLQFCKKLTKKIYDMTIAKYFRNPVNTREVPNYKVKKPMDLGTVTSKLESESYKTAEQWKNDMKLIWDNARDFNPEGTLLNQIASELKLYFEKKTAVIPLTDFELWQQKVKRQHQKVMSLMAAKPRSNKKSRVLLRPPTPA